MSVAFMFSIGMYAFGSQQKKYPGFTAFGTGFGLIAFGFLLLGYRDILPDFVTIVFANLLLIAGLAIFCEGVRHFIGEVQKISPVSIAAFAAGVIIFYYYTYPSPDVNARIIGITAIYAVLSGLCAFKLIRNARETNWQLPDLVTGAILIYFSLFHLFRCLWTFRESPIQSFMSAGTVHAASFISVIVFVTGSTFGFVWMVSKRLEQELVELASLDPLTKVLNRRGVDDLALREFAKVDRDLHHLVTVVMDIDNFKEVNDTFGHTIGDQVLVAVAELMDRNLRPYDILGRIGGDEFIIILPNTEMPKALAIIERLRQLIEQEEFPIIGHSTQITASFGLAEATADSCTLENMLSLADKALYQSKHKGANQVSVFSDAGTTPR